MTRLQQFIEQNYNTEVKQIDINKAIINEVNISEIEGDELDLTKYSNIKRLRINSKFLKTPLKKLILKNNRQLEMLFLSSPDFVELDISGCSSLKAMEINKRAFTEICFEIEIIGGEDTQLLQPEFHNLLKEDMEKRKGEKLKTDEAIEIIPKQ